jgi:hypothetical protein
MESRNQNTFEQATGVTLSPDYRAFLNDYAGGAALGDKDLVYSLATAQTLLSPYPFDHPRIERPLHRAHVVYLGRLRDAGVLVYEGAGAEHPTPPERFDGMVTIGFAESPDAWETGGAPSHVVVLDPDSGAVLLVPIEPPGVVHRVGASFEAWLKKVSRKTRAKAATPRKTAGVRKAAAGKSAEGKPTTRKAAVKKAATPRKRAAKPAPATEVAQPVVTPEVAEQPTVPQGATAEAAPAKATKRKPTAKKPTAKKTTAKKAATARKTTARKKPVAKKPAAKKATAKKAAAPRKRTTKAKSPTPPPTDVTTSPDRQAA